MNKKLIAFLTILSLLLSFSLSTAYSATLVGTKCYKIGATITKSNVKYICTKKSGKLVYQASTIESKTPSLTDYPDGINPAVPPTVENTDIGPISLQNLGVTAFQLQKSFEGYTGSNEKYSVVLRWQNPKLEDNKNRIGVRLTINGGGVTVTPPCDLLIAACKPTLYNVGGVKISIDILDLALEVYKFGDLEKNSEYIVSVTPIGRLSQNGNIILGYPRTGGFSTGSQGVPAPPGVTFGSP